MRQAGVGASQRVGDVRVALGESLDVQLVDDRVGPRRVGTAVVAPRERLIDDHAARHRRRRVDAADAHVVAAEAVAEQRAAVPEAAGDGARVGIEQQLGRVVAQPLMRRVATVHAEAVALSGADVGDVSVPHEVGALDQRMGGELGAALVEEHEVDRLGALGEDREVGAGSVPGCAERRVGAGPRGAAAGRASGGGRLWNSHDSTRFADRRVPDVTGAVRRGGQPAWGVQREYVDAAGARRRVSAERRSRGGGVHASRSMPATSPPVFVRPGERLPRGRAEHRAGGRARARRRGASSARRAVRIPPPGDARRPPRADGHQPGAVRASRRAAAAGAGRRSSTRFGPARGGGSAISVTCASLGVVVPASSGAAMLLVNPLHAVRPGTPQEPSPYFPSSRLFRNPLYLRIQDLPGARDDPDGRRARCARPSGCVTRRSSIAIGSCRSSCARSSRSGRSFRGDPAFDAYVAREGMLLERYACFCVLAERHAGLVDVVAGSVPACRQPGGARRWSTSDRSRVDFHRWLQWSLDTQLARAGRELPLVHDLAVGFAPGRRRRVAVAGRGRVRCAHRCAPGRFQSRRPGLGRAALRPGPAARGRICPAGRDHAPDDGRGHRGADRPRHGPVPAVVGAARRPRSVGRRVRPLPGERAARHPRARERTRRLRRRSARISAPSNRASALSCAGADCSRTGWPGSSRDRPSASRPRRLRR